MASELRRDLAAIAPHAHLSVAAGAGDATGDRGFSGGSGGATGDTPSDARGPRPEPAPRASERHPSPTLADPPTDHTRAGIGAGLDIFA